MPLGLHKSYGYSSRPKKLLGGSGPSNTKEEQIKDTKDMIRFNDILISYYERLRIPNAPCSFEYYTARLDKEATDLQERRETLQREYDHATNGEIPALRRHGEKLREKLKRLKIDVIPKLFKRVKSLRERIAALEEELTSDGFNKEQIENMMEDMIDA